MTQELTTHTPQHLATADLRADIRESLESAKSANTTRMYSSAWRAFAAFCEGRGLCALPASRETVAAYLEWLANYGRPDIRKGRSGQTMKPAKVSTLELHRAAISYNHKAAQLSDPTQDEWMKIQLKGIRRKLADRGTKQTGRTPKAAAALAEVTQLVSAYSTDPTHPKALEATRNRALLLVGFAGAFRRSELVSVALDDVTFTAEGMTILLSKSKTDQEGAGMVKHFALMTDPALCPVRALRAWINAAGIRSGYVFRKIDRWGNIGKDAPITPGMVARIIKDACTLVGLDSHQFSGHSLRRGFITTAARAGMMKHQIAAQTGHKPTSTTIDTYIQTSGADALKAVRAVFGEGK